MNHVDLLGGKNLPDARSDRHQVSQRVTAGRRERNGVVSDAKPGQALDFFGRKRTGQGMHLAAASHQPLGQILDMPLQPPWNVIGQCTRDQ